MIKKKKKPSKNIIKKKKAVKESVKKKPKGPGTSNTGPKNKKHT